MTVLHETNSDNEDINDVDSNKMMLYLFHIIIELFIDDEHSRKSISSCFHVFTYTCMPVSITTSHECFLMMMSLYF